MPHRPTRRRFLQAAAAGTSAFFAWPLRAEDKKPSANERLHVGVIGVAGQGAYNWTEVDRAGAEIVALCDVDEGRAGPARGKFPKATFDVDFRDLLDRKGIDAVIVATPDHTHAVATVAALKSGRHVYCEKPLTHDVAEARAVAETAAREKKVTQMGTQIHNHPEGNYRRCVELIQGGAIGAVKEVHVWCGTSYGGAKRPTETEEVPKGLHWDLWLGTAPERPFYRGKKDDRGYCYEPFNWRKWWDFGGGGLTDMACHHVDLPFWALKLRHPTKVSAEGSPRPDPEAAADWLIVNYEFPARGDLPAVKLTWYDGGKRPPHFAQGQLPKWGDGSLFMGEKGMLLAGYTARKLLPEKEFEGFVPPKPTIRDSVGHHKEWVEACKSGDLKTTCNFDYAGALTEAVLLGAVSYRVGKPLEWDAKDLKATNCPEAEKYLRRQYRKPWTL